jgi:hypothetical protein
MSPSVKRGKTSCSQETRSFSVVMFCRVKIGPSSALLPVRRFRPFTLRWRSASLGVDWMKMPSVTGRKAHAPYVPELETSAEAAFSVALSLDTRHWKIVCELFPYAHWGGQPAAAAKA